MPCLNRIYTSIINNFAIEIEIYEQTMVLYSLNCKDIVESEDPAWTHVVAMTTWFYIRYKELRLRSIYACLIVMILGPIEICPALDFQSGHSFSD